MKPRRWVRTLVNEDGSVASTFCVGREEDYGAVTYTVGKGKPSFYVMGDIIGKEKLHLEYCELVGSDLVKEIWKVATRMWKENRKALAERRN